MSERQMPCDHGAFRGFLVALPLCLLLWAIIIVAACQLI
jgi:hypothetical protein